jgi:hypothetical protein
MMTEQEHLEAIEQAAYEWWLGRRPRNWTEDEHVKNPVINCCSTYEITLANAVAKMRRSVLAEKGWTEDF